jgi:hypothetical protein
MKKILTYVTTSVPQDTWQLTLRLNTVNPAQLTCHTAQDVLPQPSVPNAKRLFQ